MNPRFSVLVLCVLLLFAGCTAERPGQVPVTSPDGAPLLLVMHLSGAIFTTDAACIGTNINIFQTRDDVYIDGGPVHPGAAGLNDGYYYVKVTAPGGELLGTSVESAIPAPVLVADGEFDQCYQLSAILIKASDGTPGYDQTSNPGGEYKVWVSQDPLFAPSASKTDNFKVKPIPETPPHLFVYKFYDANANGLNDDGILLDGWKVLITDGLSYVRWTPVDIQLDPDDYLVTEFQPVEPGWLPTTPDSVWVTIPPDATVYFGNLCLGPGGGHTLGFWSNRNGKAQMNDGGTMAPELALLVSLNLRNAAGDGFDPMNYDVFRAWLLNATAVNMAYMLSAQLAAMELNVEAGFVNGGAIIYAPGTASANSLGFATVDAVMAEANLELSLHGLTPNSSLYRGYQQSLKDALDGANNNGTFVQPTPCEYTFPE